jgi:hypothetical protein
MFKQFSNKAQTTFKQFANNAQTIFKQSSNNAHVVGEVGDVVGQVAGVALQAAALSISQQVDHHGKTFRDFLEKNNCQLFQCLKQSFSMPETLFLNARNTLFSIPKTRSTKNLGSTEHHNFPNTVKRFLFCFRRIFFS